MVYSDTATKLGLIQDCEMNVFSNYGDISDNSARKYDFNARLNRSYDKLATFIMSADGRWQFDDTNYTDLPIGSTSIGNGQKTYVFDVEFLDVVKVVSQDGAGNKTVLKPFDITDPLGDAYLTTNTNGGIPIAYDKTGSVLNLYPTPNYDKALGLTVHYRRKPSYFAYDDTTKAVGVPAVFHRYLSLDASRDYAVSKQLTQKNDLTEQVREMEAMITEWYSMRSKDEAKYVRGIIRSSR